MEKIIKRFECGCELEVALEDGQIVGINYEPENVRLDCPRTWEVIGSGLTKGIFQLETPLGQSAAKACKPTNIEELSDVSSILRPGCGDAELDGKTLKARYFDRKNGLEEPVPPDPLLHEVLEPTRGVFIYQEQAMAASTIIAGFDGKQANALRKAAGKKNVQLMSELKSKFIEGAQKAGRVTTEQAERVFNIIEASQRYSFNKCLCPKTLVHTKIGSVTLEELKVGTYILDHQSNYVRVNAKYYNGKRQTYLYEFSDRSALRCTPDHKVLTEKGLIPIQEAHKQKLRVGHTYVARRSFPQIIETIDIEVENEDHIFCANNVCVSNSHGISYALDAIYFSAYAKAHFPRAFFLAELVHAKDIEEIGAVIDDSLNFGVEICKPDLRLMNEEFTLTNKCIQYGLGRIKGCGESYLKKLIEAVGGRDIATLTWTQLMQCLSQTSSGAASALIYSGALDFTLLTRSRMIFELSIFNRLTEKQQEYIVERNTLNALTEMVELGSGKSTYCANVRSLAKLQTILNEYGSPPNSLRDTPNQIFEWEIQYMGYAFTTSEVDESIANCTCYEFFQGKICKEYTLVGTVVRVKTILTKGKQPGQEMAFIEFKDSTNKVSGVVFPQNWLEYRHKLFEGNKLMFVGERGKGNKSESLIINRVMQL